MEPAAVLVAAFDVEVGGPRECRDRLSRTACQLTPESNQTSRMSISLRNAACGVAVCRSALFRRASSCFGLARVPGFGALLFERAHDAAG